MKIFSVKRTGTRQGLLKKPLLVLVSAIFWLSVWHIAAVKTGNSLLLPGPAETAGKLAVMARTTGFWLTVLKSLVRVLAGMLSGIILGTVLAVICRISELTAAVIMPMVRIIRTTPVVSFIILALLWLGRGVLPSFIAALMVLPAVFQNVLTGFEEIPAGHRKLIAVFRPSFIVRITKIYIPDIFPYFISAVKTSAGLSWKAGIAAEVLAFSPDSIGRRLSEAKSLLETEELFAWTAAVIIISLIIELLFSLLLKRFGTVRKKEERVHVKS